MKEFKKKLAFVVKDKDGKEVSLCVKMPSVEQGRELQATYNRSFMDSLASGAPLFDKLDAVAREQGVWSDSHQKQVDEIDAKLKQNELKLLKRGNAGLTKKAAYQLAIETKKLRNEKLILLMPKNRLGEMTAEGQAKNAQFNHQVALCTYYNDGPEAGKRYFDGLEDFKARSSEETALQAARNLSYLSYGIDPTFEDNLTENKLLAELGHIDKKGRFVNKQGKLVDEDGRLVNEEGRYINEKNQLVDRDGDLVDEEGKFIVESADFLPDED